MEEIWKDIEGYKGLYQVSNLGRVKSLNYKHTKKEKIIKSLNNNRGYLLVTLFKNNAVKHYSVHRLVAKAFLENPNNYPCVNHKDENKENNKVNNLEWCTQKYNINYGSGIKRMSENHKKQVYCLETDKIYNSLIECAKELNVNQSNITKVLKGKLKQAKGYTFRYANQILFTGVE